MASVAEALQDYIQYVRDELLPEYDAIPEGVFAATFIRQDLDKAVKALAEGDSIACINCLQTLKEYS